MKKTLLLKKIHLESFIDLLLKLYEDGVDFVDIEGTLDNKQDHISIEVKEEYLIPIQDREEKTLTQEDIDNLIN